MLTQDDRDALTEAQGIIDERLAILARAEAYVLDLSIREPATGSPLGHTLADKHALFDLTDKLGFRDRVVATLGGRDTVDDDFLRALSDRDADLRGCFAFIAPGRMVDGAVAPDPSMLRQADYGPPNVIFHTEISAARRARSGQSPDDVIAALEASIAWSADRLPKPAEGVGRIYINLSDLLDCFTQEPEFACAVVKKIAELRGPTQDASRIQALMFEDPRGSYFPFQHAAVVRWLRRYLPPPCKILVHPHAGNGLEHASVIDSVLAGADGAWLGFTSHAATNGHASSLVYLTNLMRAGNQAATHLYDSSQFVPAARRMADIHTGGPPPPEEPVAGGLAYRDVLANFSQTVGLPGDLPPESVGAKHGWRIVPAIAQPAALAARLREEGIWPDADPASDTVHAMAELIHARLRAGEKIEWDRPQNLQTLFELARAWEPQGGLDQKGSRRPDWRTY